MSVSKNSRLQAKKRSAAGVAKQKKKNQRKRSRLLPYYIFSASLLIAGGWTGYKTFFENPFSSGLTYLEKQESKDIESLQKTINQRQISNLIKAIDNNTADIFDFFRDSLILGDSRALGFMTYGFVPSERVLADGGYTIENIAEFNDEVESMEPQFLFLSFGINDLGLKIGEDQGENGYGKVLKEQVQALEKVSPNSTVVINSIIAPAPFTLESTPSWANWKEYNRQIKQACKENGWVFVNNDSLAQEGNADIYNEDGVHFPSWFYPIWAENMYKTTIKAIL